MNKAICLILLLIPFIHLVWHNFDIWSTQGYFLQFGVLGLFSYKIFKNNKPLACLLFWFGILTFYLTFTYRIKSNIYPTFSILAFFNFLTIVIFYEFCRKNITKESVIWLANKYLFVICFMAIYGTFQYFQIDQFYNSIFQARYKYVVGTIGNPMHFSHYIAVASPLMFLLEKKRQILGLLLSFLIILLTKSTTGLVCFMAIMGFYSLIFKEKKIKWLFLAFLIVLIGVVIKQVDFFADNTRFEMWKRYYQIWLQKPFTGFGLGMVRTIAQAQEIKYDGALYAHTHSEYLNLLIEGGVVALLIVIWGLWDYFKKSYLLGKDKVNIAFVSMFIGFLFCSLFGFPAHLWVINSLGILAYSWAYKEKII